MLYNKGVVLYIVLVSILAALVIASSILNLLLSQTRFSQHGTSRVQAYYAARAGLNYALEQLRIGGSPASGWYYTNPADNSCPANAADCTAGGCSMPTDSDFPSAVIQPVKIVFMAPGSQCTVPNLTDPTHPTKRVCSAPANTFCIQSTATYNTTSP